MARAKMNERLQKDSIFTGTNTNTKIRIAPKVRRSETTIQRAYYINREVVGLLDEAAEKFKTDKSKIVEDALIMYLNQLDM